MNLKLLPPKNVLKENYFRAWKNIILFSKTQKLGKGIFQQCFIHTQKTGTENTQSISCTEKYYFPFNLLDYHFHYLTNFVDKIEILKFAFNSKY